LKRPAPLHLSALGLVNALGRGKEEVALGLFRGDTSGMVLEEGWLPRRPARVGRVRGDLPQLPRAFAADASVYRLIPRAVVFPDDLEEIRGLFRFSHASGTGFNGLGEGQGILEIWKNPNEGDRDHLTVKQLPGISRIRGIAVGGQD